MSLVVLLLIAKCAACIAWKSSPLECTQLCQISRGPPNGRKCSGYQQIHRYPEDPYFSLDLVHMSKVWVLQPRPGHSCPCVGELKRSYSPGLVKSANLLTPSEPDAGSSAHDGNIYDLFIYLFIANLGEIHRWAFLSPRQYIRCASVG